MKTSLALVAVLATSAPLYAEPLGEVNLTAAQRKTRATLVRDTAAAAGMTNAALLAGIGEIETNFAHCWSEATWACKGPASATCNGGPVIAGASDGPCSAEQGGLGMFQFDSGTYAQTIATYGKTIVTMQGNVDAVIPFLVTRAVQSVDGIDTPAQALAWMNSIKIKDGDAAYEDWLYFVAWRYNGCKGCTSQINKYRMGTNKLRDEFGAAFWKITPPGGGGSDDPPGGDPPAGDDPDDPAAMDGDAGCSTGGSGGLVLGALAAAALCSRRGRSSNRRV